MDDIKSYIRDINLEILTGSFSTTIDISRRYNNKFRWFYPSRKLIKCITDHGGVLSGSRALRCHLINNKPLLERRCNDWDFIVTPNMAFDICSDMNINRIPEVGDVISIKNQRHWRHPSYSEAYRVGIVDVQMIIREELPEFTQTNGVRVSSFGYSLSKKIEVMDDIESEISKLPHGKSDKDLQGEYTKHNIDLKQIIVKFNSIKNAQNR